MGTRGILGFRKKNPTGRGGYIRKGAYNHFDSFPGGLGHRIAAFVLNLTPEGRQAMIEQVEALTWVTDGTRSVGPGSKPRPSDAEIEKYNALGYASDDFSGKAWDWAHGKIGKVVPLNPPPTCWYALLRNLQNGFLLFEIHKGDLTHIIDDSSWRFNKRCEWGYFIDLEEGELETWKDGKRADVVKFDDLTESYMIEELEPRLRGSEAGKGNATLNVIVGGQVVGLLRIETRAGECQP
ncbi:hypothetical protein BU16DRAFT_622359 [Lophium mytilinum]|uniref:Uncharacterized protein n=1 Tax=Lophium mytilinum TaxID=390894 RepID=A0A6A6QC60_9PEZI|nr:hypothetical protein BU16DRAFT_622359 [Lophium mytilinum]